MWRVRMRQATENREAGRGKGRGALRCLTRVLRQIVGAPDYSAYLEHCRHAGHPPQLSEREYVSEFFERQGRTARCC
jgi:uncharacterized short protein YbdD (DUF466 family)